MMEMSFSYKKTLYTTFGCIMCNLSSIILVFPAFTDFRVVVFWRTQMPITQARKHIFSKFKNLNKVDILTHLLVYNTCIWME